MYFEDCFLDDYFPFLGKIYKGAVTLKLSAGEIDLKLCLRVHIEKQIMILVNGQAI